MPTAITDGIRVTVESEYLAERSSPASGRYAFAYKVRIENVGKVTTQLRSRHWIITHGDGRVEEVRGDGVVGAQPVLKAGEHFEYTSWAMLETAYGTMRGSYTMVPDGGASFDAEIPLFRLALPYTLN